MNTVVFLMLLIGTNGAGKDDVTVAADVFKTRAACELNLHENIKKYKKALGRCEQAVIK